MTDLSAALMALGALAFLARVVRLWVDGADLGRGWGRGR